MTEADRHDVAHQMRRAYESIRRRHQGARHVEPTGRHLGEAIGKAKARGSGCLLRAAYIRPPPRTPHDTLLIALSAT